MVTLNPFERGPQESVRDLGGKSTQASDIREPGSEDRHPGPRLDFRKEAATVDHLVDCGVMPIEGGVNTWFKFKVDDVLGGVNVIRGKGSVGGVGARR